MNFLYLKPKSVVEREQFINQTIFAFAGVVSVGLILLIIAYGNAIVETAISGLAILIVAATIVFFFKNGLTGKITSSLLLLIVALGTIVELSTIGSTTLSPLTKIMDILVQLSKFYLSVRLVSLIFSKVDKVNEIDISTPAMNSENKYENLERLKKLFDSGAISEEEFNIEKKKIIN